MNHIFDRTRMLLGDEAMEKLKNSRVAVLGLGGVGGSCAETLIRSGLGKITIVDMDIISESNINRQIIATTKTIGRKKTEVMEERLRDINPGAEITVHDTFILNENIGEIITEDTDYVIDCIDTVTAKLNVAQYCYENGIPLVSSMGAGNKLDPSELTFTDIYKTSVCPLAKVMRRELRIRAVEKLDVLYSTEPAMEPYELEDKENPTLIRKRKAPGSVAFVPPAAGIMLAGFTVRKLTGL